MIKLNRATIHVHSIGKAGRKMFKRSPTILLKNLPGGEIAYLHIDFLERWCLSHTGSGTDKFGAYDIISFDDGADPENWFDIVLYFNKEVDIIGQADKKCWLGYVRTLESIQKESDFTTKNTQFMRL